MSVQVFRRWKSHARVLLLDSGRNRTQCPQKLSACEDKDTPQHTYSCNARMGRLKALPRLCSNIMIDTGALNAWRCTGIVVSVENDKGTHQSARLLDSLGG